MNHLIRLTGLDGEPVYIDPDYVRQMEALRGSPPDEHPNDAIPPRTRVESGCATYQLCLVLVRETPDEIIALAAARHTANPEEPT